MSQTCHEVLKFLSLYSVQSPIDAERINVPHGAFLPAVRQSLADTSSAVLYLDPSHTWPCW